MTALIFYIKFLTPSENQGFRWGLFFLCFAFPHLFLAQEQTSGLFLNTPESFQGYTLFGNNTTTYLIDNCGLVVNSWQSNFRPAESAYLLENGNLLRTAKRSGNFNAGGAGGGFELYDWEGHLLWSYELLTENLQAHHDIEPLPNGNFLALVWEKISEAEGESLGRKYNESFWSERIVEIEIVGQHQANIVWEWRLKDHLVQDYNPAIAHFGEIAAHPELVDVNYIGGGHSTAGNWIHLNAIDYHPTLDQIVISSRLWSEIWVIDHSTTTAEAASHTGGRYGKGGDLLYRFGNPQSYQQAVNNQQVFQHQHDVQWITEGVHAGKMLVFNNDNASNQSSIEIWLPPMDTDGFYLDIPHSVELELPHLHDNFYSPYMSSAQYLPNGNLLVCEGMRGRFFEVDSDLNIVWDYINPVNKNGNPAIQGGTVRFNECFKVTRYAPDYPAFGNKKLTPTVPVEINPWESDCFIPTPVVETSFDIELIQNPVTEYLVLDTPTEHPPLAATLINNLGQIVVRFEITSGKNQLDLLDIPRGVYWIVFELEEIPSIPVVIQ